LAGLFLLSFTCARADVTLLLEEPYGAFGGMNPTGHAAVYLSRVAPTPRFPSGDVFQAKPAPSSAVTIGSAVTTGSRFPSFHTFMPCSAYAVQRTDQVPAWTSEEQIASLRDSYRRAWLEQVAPDNGDGTTPDGDWDQLIGEAYDRTISTASG